MGKDVTFYGGARCHGKTFHMRMRLKILLDFQYASDPDNSMYIIELGHNRLAMFDDPVFTDEAHFLCEGADLFQPHYRQLEAEHNKRKKPK